jgi:hypothetical protein
LESPDLLNISPSPQKDSAKNNIPTGSISFIGLIFSSFPLSPYSYPQIKKMQRLSFLAI